MNPRWPSSSVRRLIVYAPGTQHSSLFPSYLDPGLSEAIAAQSFRRSSCSSRTSSPTPRSPAAAPWISSGAPSTSRAGGGCRLPTPCLITHYLMNDPGTRRAPRRTCHWAGSRRSRIRGWCGSRTSRTGSRGGTTRPRFSARSSSRFLDRWTRTQKVAVLLHGAGPPTRSRRRCSRWSAAGVGDLAVELTVFHKARPTRRVRAVLRFTRPPARGARRPDGDRALPQSCTGGASTTSSCSNRRACIAARTCGAASHLSRAGSMRCGEAAGFGPRHRGVLSAAVPARTRARRGQLRGSHVLSLLMPGALRPLHHRHVVGGAGGRASDALRTRVPLTHKRPTSTCSGAAPAQGRDLRGSRPVLLHFARAVPRTTPLDGMREVGIAVGRRCRPPVAAAAPLSVIASHNRAARLRAR